MSIAYLGDGLGLVRLLGIVCGDTVSLELLSFGIILIIGPEQIDIIIAGLLFLLLGGSGGSITGEDGTCATGTGEGRELSLVGLDVLVPASNIWVSQVL